MKYSKLKIYNKLRTELHRYFANLCLMVLQNVISHPLILTRKKSLIFAPHQDDETLGCGGMIALKRQQGILVNVVFLTDGSNSHRGLLLNL